MGSRILNVTCLPKKENICCVASTDMYEGIRAGDDSQSAKLQRFSTFVMLEDKA